MYCGQPVRLSLRQVISLPPFAAMPAGAILGAWAILAANVPGAAWWGIVLVPVAGLSLYKAVRNVYA